VNEYDYPPDLQKGLMTPADPKQFVEETRVDTLTPAVGNIHGMLKSMFAGETRKRLDGSGEYIAKVKEIAAANNPDIAEEVKEL
jgi:fructose-bisphosphate aldolase class II